MMSSLMAHLQTTQQISDLRDAFDNALVDIGPEEDNFFYLKPFAGLEVTTDSAFYVLEVFI